MKTLAEGSQAVAKTAALCRPDVISAYPITPQTHIVEGLAQLVADGELDSEFINVESEHSACSAVLGASAAGGRTFSSTSSQGLLLMIEVIFNAAGMRLPIVMAVANRAVSAPISIWNDHQDSISARDAGWIQFYAESIQEAVDQVCMAYRVGEDHRVLLPAMVCMDGYILTHGEEVVDMPEADQVDKFLPPIDLPVKLDVENPLTMGYLGAPDVYLETRHDLHDAVLRALEVIPEAAAEFEKVFNRKLHPLVEAYRLEDADRAIVAMGSVCGTIKDAIDDMRDEGEKVGLMRIVTYRPMPTEAIVEALEGVGQVAVLDKSISLGQAGPVATDLRAALQTAGACRKISGFVAGLGGRDITKDTIREIFERLAGDEVTCQFIGLKTAEEIPTAIA